MSAAAKDIFGMTDEFRFVYQQLTGNGSVTVRVESLDNTHALAKAGVMIREGLGAGARHAMVVITPSSGVSFQKRVIANDVSTAWQTWRIPLSEFSKAGVKVTSIKKITIGVGEREKPAAGGAGLIYIDDIGFGRPFDSAPPVEPAPVVTGSYSSLILADRPYAYYRFDDASSNDKDAAADATGAHHGIYVGKPSLVSDAPGTLGGTSVKIAATTPDSYVTAQLASLGSLLGKGVTFEFWIKSKDTRTGKRIFGSFNTGSNTTVTLASNSGPTAQGTVGSTQVFMRKQGGGDYGAAFNASVANIYDGNWHHVVWTAENMEKPAANPYRVYVDGVSVPLTYGATWTAATFADFGNPFYIANAGRAAPLAAGAMIDGQLDEFAIYNSVLTPEQVLAHYWAAVPGNAK